MQRLAGHCVLWLFRLLSLTPFCVLYPLSSAAAWLLYHVVGYRRRIVRSNIATSFPDKNTTELRHIERDFYRFFCDYAVETLKTLTMTPSTMRRRMRMEGVERMEEALQKSGLVFVYLGHYGNWEWISSLPLWTHRPDTHSAQIYRPLNNKPFDYMFYRLRTRFGAENISKYDTMRHIVRLRRAGRKTIIGFISDQSPARESVHDWTHFLNHDTALITGTERIAKKLGAAIFFADVVRERRGHYTTRFRLITDRPTAYPDYRITHTYMTCLEQMIRRTPALWLWSHNRWKIKREE